MTTSRIAAARAACQRPDVVAALEDARRQPVLRYPWQGLEERIGEDGLALIGYGSLVNAGSAAVTLAGETVETSEPVVAYGGRRLFDYRMSAIPPRYACPAEPRERAALNVRPTGSSEDLFNGVRLVLPREDLPAFRDRERRYDLAQLVWLPWARLEAPPQIAWVLTCPGSDLDVDPHPRYVEVCRAGALSFGEEFLTLWDETTFRADGVTTL